MKTSILLFVGVGVVGYKLVGGSDYTLLDCFYMTIITLSTVGFGEVIDLGHHPGGRLFTMFLIVLGMGVLLYVVSNITAFIVEGELLEIFWRRKMNKMISKMKDHYIVCGAGRIGHHIIQEFSQTGREVVAIDIDREKVESLRQAIPDVPVIQGEAIEDALLDAAGISRAAGLVVATGHDKDNMVITMTARQMNPKLRIISRCNELGHFDKIKKSGADAVVSSNLIGGLRMASEMVRPTVVSFLDAMLRDKEKSLRVEEVNIPAGSPLAGKTVADSGVWQIASALLLAVKKADGDWEYNPKDDFLLSEGMDLIIMGGADDKKRVEEFVAG